jgi:monothiol glutaredoxin
MSDIKDEIDSTIEENDVVVFMKGTPEQPQCGFSDTAVQVLESYGVSIEGRDVLQDPDLRQAIKEYSDWPTIPQIYIDGEFIGGSDILRELHQKGELEEKLENVPTG